MNERSESPSAMATMPGKIRTLLFSTLFPSASRPGHGTFVETRLRELLKTGAIETKVVAPVPWFPLSGARFGEHSKLAATPAFELRNNIEVYHPRYFLPPKVGMNLAPHTLARGALPTIRKLIANGFDFDLIDAHYYYPDGVAAGLIAQELGKPFIVTSRGSDLNLIADFRYPKKLILKTAGKATASIGVSAALTSRLKELGADPSKLLTFRNGVDLERFTPEDRRQSRKKLALPDTKILLSVGNLVELKGHGIAIAALAELPEDLHLVIAGTGPERENLQKLAERLDVIHRVIFAGRIDSQDLRWWYSAADALVLCSSREGLANVLLESLACGTPVIATPVGGTPEVIANNTAGRLMTERSYGALVDAYTRLIADYPDRQAVRTYAEQFSWQETSTRQVTLFRETCHA